MNVYQIRQTLRTKSIYEIELRVAYYARVSTEKEEQKNSIINQRQHFENFIASVDKWRLVGGYIDDGISGIHAEKREEFQRMIADARAGRFDLVVTKEISRFARNTLDSIQYTRELLSYGVCIWFQNDNINTVDEDSEFRLTIMAGVAQDEIRKLSSRVRFGHEQSIKRGVVLGNARIYGYDKKDGRLTINKDEAPMIQMIFEKYATGKWTTPRLEKLIYDMGYRNHKGGKINRAVIQHIIQNPKYKGWYAGGKVKIVDMFTKKQEFLPQEQWNLFKDDGSRVPAIVSEELWEAANKIYRERGDAIRNRRTSYKVDNVFTGKIFCGDDGSPYWLKRRQLRGKEDAKWVCSSKLKNGTCTCKSIYLDEKELRIMIADLLNRAAGDIDAIVDKYIEIYLRVLPKKEDNQQAMNRIDSQIKEIEKKKDKILDFNLSGAISDDEFVRRNNEFNSQIKDLRQQRQLLEPKETELSKVQDGIKSLTAKIKEYANIQEGDIDSQVVNRLIEKIVAYPQGERKIKLQIVLKSDEIKAYNYEYPMLRSGNMMLNIYPEQNTVFYRNPRNKIGNSPPITYTYSLVI